MTHEASSAIILRMFSRAARTRRMPGGVQLGRRRSVWASTLPILLVFTIASLAAQQAPVFVMARTLLEHYSDGDYQAAEQELRRFDIRAPDALPGFGETAEIWIAESATGDRARRRLIAATVALAIAHAHKDATWVQRAPFAVWACSIVRRSGEPPSNGERLWYRASVSALEDLGGWFLLDASPDLIHDQGPAGALVRIEGPEGHLSHALARYPDDPRLQLAQIEKLDRKLRQPGGADVESRGLIRSYDVLDAKAFASLDEAYRSLVASAEVRDEVTVRLAFLDVRQREWKKAVDELDRLPRNPPTVLRYAVELIRGWALGQLGDRDDAIAAYERGIAFEPASAQLKRLAAAELFLRNDASSRERAVELMESSLGSDPAMDRWSEFFNREAVRWPLALEELQSALR